MKECPTCGDVFDSERGMKAHHQHHDKPYYDVVVQEEMGMSPEEFVQKYHREEKLPLKDTGELIGTSATTIQKMAERHGVDTLSPSEAKEAMWERTDDADKFLKEAHETTREMVNEGEHNFQDPDFKRVLSEEFREYAKDGVPDELVEWWEENPEKRSEFAAKGTEAREENGMAGATGQDNPNWRGGKNVLDAVKKQLGPYWKERREEAKQRDGYECQNCGATDCKLDSHHIIPVMCGGTHGFWNLMTLCESCHHKAEWFTRKYPEFDPVLVE